MFYLWPKYTAVVQKGVAEFMRRAGAGDTPKEDAEGPPAAAAGALPSDLGFWVGHCEAKC